MNFAVGWRQVAVVFYMLALATGIVFSSYSIVSTPIGRTFGASHGLQMGGIGAMMLVGATMSPTVGGWLDRFPFRSVLAISGGLIAVGLLALSFAQAMWQIIAIYAVFIAVPAVVCGPMGASTLLMRWFVKRRGRAMGIAVAGLSAGSFIFPVLIQQLIEWSDWRTALRILAVIVGATLVPAALFLTVEQPADRGLHPDGAAEPPAEARSQRENGAKIPAREVLTDLNFWLASLALGLPLSAGTGTTSNIVLVAADIGVAATYAAVVMSAIAIASALGKVVFAVIGDRFDPRVLLSSGMVMFSAGLTTLAFAPSLPFLFAGAALIAFGSGLLNPMWGVLFPRTFDSAIVGRVMGLAMSVSMVLAVIAPVLVGTLRDATGAYQAPFLLYAGLILVCAISVKAIRVRSA
jgi:MFS family permease